MTYKHNKVWRLSHTAKRNIGRKRYYHKYPGLYLAGRRWDPMDADFVLTAKLSDRVLHVLLGRSIQAIQNKRCKLNKEDRIR